MQQNAPFCVLLKKINLGGMGGANPPRPPTAFSLSRVGMYALYISIPYCNLQWFMRINIYKDI